jgi:hypothetical protein
LSQAEELQKLLTRMTEVLNFDGYSKESLAFGFWFSSITTYQLYETNNVGALLEAVGRVSTPDVEISPEVDVA